MNGIRTWSVNDSTIDESPMAYKPSDEIIRYLKDTVDVKHIARTVYNFKAN
ncbi:RtcB family protein [Ruminococcus sp. XPD3002]|uniref:RtcB family protein n=1 Tax=Ruminococcus sp. XPD3002 TaxID=1452269 RepID=UPI000A4C3BA2